MTGRPSNARIFIESRRTRRKTAYAGKEDLHLKHQLMHFLLDLGFKPSRICLKQFSLNSDWRRFF